EDVAGAPRTGPAGSCGCARGYRRDRQHPAGPRNRGKEGGMSMGRPVPTPTDPQTLSGKTDYIAPSRLQELEVVIERGVKAFIEVGNALLEIREKRLYKEKYPTFEEYLDQRWGLKRQRGYELMEAAQIATAVSEISDIRVERESHAAALAPL